MALAFVTGIVQPGKNVNGHWLVTACIYVQVCRCYKSRLDQLPYKR